MLLDVCIHFVFSLLATHQIKTEGIKGNNFSLSISVTAKHYLPLVLSVLGQPRHNEALAAQPFLSYSD